MKKFGYRFTLLILAVLITLSTVICTSAEILSLDTAADWARDGITSAVKKGFVPEDLQGDFANIITRQEFCRMAVKFVEYKMGKSIDAVLTDRGVSRNPNAFSDTDDPDILAAYALAITSGTLAPTDTAPGLFTPKGSFNRQQAAAMIMNTCGVIGMNITDPPVSDFTDLDKADNWAKSGINFVRFNGIMGGVSTTAPVFSPRAPYTRQESIVTFDRIEWPKNISGSEQKFSRFDPKTPVDDLIDSFIAGLTDMPAVAEKDLRIAIKALALNNPLFAPHEVMEMLCKSVSGFKKYPDDTAVPAVYSYSGYIEISQSFLDDLIKNEPQNLKYLFAHELTHALNIANKSEAGKGFLFNDMIQEENGLWRNIKVHGLEWSGRITEGLTDIYSFSAMGEKHTESTDEFLTISFIESPFCYPAEQAAAFMFLNAFGRQNVDRAYFGTQKEYDDFEAYCQKLTGGTFRELMNTVTETVAWMYTSSYAPGTDVNEVNRKIKKYMDLILKVCEKRSKDSYSTLTISEIDELIAVSVRLQDTEYMEMYYAKLNELKAAVK